MITKSVKDIIYDRIIQLTIGVVGGLVVAFSTDAVRIHYIKLVTLFLVALVAILFLELRRQQFLRRERK
ncbi:hypothetical protein J4206_04075 [Candidatus Woesearchaeota archaeon]|nr:hypothetical protein [Candidatus Woesearchaeota archaeon]